LAGSKLKRAGSFVTSAVIGGLFIVVPVYLAVLLLLKGMKAVAGPVRPLAKLLPEWVPAERLLSLLLVFLLCFLVGAAIRTRVGLAVLERVEVSVLQRIPGYDLIRSFTHRLAGDGDEKAWKPVLAEIEDALVPAFLIEELDDGRLTVFVPSVPTPLAGAVYILVPERVHIVDVPFTQAIRTVARWGSGSRELVAAMRDVPLRAALQPAKVAGTPPPDPPRT
jgi:uncharacterized membrane protein